MLRWSPGTESHGLRRVIKLAFGVPSAARQVPPGMIKVSGRLSGKWRSCWLSGAPECQCVLVFSQFRGSTWG